MCNVTDISRQFQIHESSYEGKIGIKVRHIDGSEKIHTIEPMRYFKSAGANLFCLTCKLLQGSKLSSNNKEYIVLDTSNGNIMLD